MEKTGQYRQGDIFIQRVETIPFSELQKKNDNVIAYGEVTGHSHRVSNFNDVEMFTDKNGDLFVRSDKEINIWHDEHSQIDLPPGEYCISRQREYDPIAAERERRVAD